jgi:MFS family permease
VALPLLATTITHNPVLISGVVIASKLPWLFFGLPAGALADRHGPRVTAVTVQVVRAALLGAFAVGVALGGVHLAIIYLLAFGLGSMETGFSASIQAAIPSVVEEHDLARANGRLYVVESTGEFLAGPALGGVVFAVAAALPFILDGASFAIAAVLLVGGLPVVVGGRDNSAAAGSKLWSEVVDGLRWLQRDRLLRLVALLVVVFSGLQGMAYGIQVLFCVKTLHLTNAEYGLFVAVGAIGDVTGGAIAARLHARFGSTRQLIGAGVVVGASYLLIWATTIPIVAALGFALEAAAVASGVIVTMALRQALVPAEMRGRVGNTFRTLAMGSFPLGAAVSGVIANGLGLRAPYLVAGVAQTAVVVLMGAPLARQISARTEGVE